MDNSLLINRSHLSVDSRISRGASSHVHNGRYKEMPVAIKVIQPLSIGLPVNPKQKEKFEREVMMLSRVKHDNVVTFIGACMEPEMMIVMEHMEGRTLKKYLMDMRSDPPDLQQAISFALDISRAMEHVHATGIIHRDLKPVNLLLTEGHRSLKVADFGQAHEKGKVKEMTSEAGSERWMAPELFSTVQLEHGQKKYDHKVDIYSFSIVLWELLTNETPFKDIKDNQVATTVSKKNRPSVENLPMDLVCLLESCWAQDPTLRPEFTEITAILLGILDKAKTNEEQSSSQLQVADSPGP